MAGKRETIEPRPEHKRYIRRNANGEWTSDQVDVGRSSTQDRKQPARTKTKPGEGDKGDR